MKYSKKTGSSLSWHTIGTKALTNNKANDLNAKATFEQVALLLMMVVYQYISMYLPKRNKRHLEKHEEKRIKVSF